MARVLAIALLFFVSVITVQASAEAVPAAGPFKKVGLFSKSKTAKSFKKKSPKIKYYKIAAKKQRQAKWHRRSLLRNNSK